MGQVKNIRITTLTDNCVFGGQKVCGEHGLSFWVEIDEHKILFDTGTGRTLLSNAKAIGVDLSEAERIIISHGHGDHMGGLAEVLEQIGPKPVHVGDGAFEPKVALRNGECRITQMRSPEEYAALGGEIILRKNSTELWEDVWLVGPIARRMPPDDPMAGNRFRLIQGERVPETFPEEQALAIHTEQGLVLVVGCTHNGLENTVGEAMRVTGDNRLHTLIGGLHLAGVSDKRLTEAAEYLRGLGVQNMVSCHCTGQRELAILYHCLGERCHFNRVGRCLSIEL